MGLQCRLTCIRLPFFEFKLLFSDFFFVFLRARVPCDELCAIATSGTERHHGDDNAISESYINSCNVRY